MSQSHRAAPIIVLALTVLTALTACTTTQTTPDAASQTRQLQPDPTNPGHVDHVLVSLPSAHFEAFSTFMEEEFQGAWFREDDTKGFLVCSTPHAYIEVWNAGRIDRPWPLGSQIAFTTEDIDRGRELAEAHYQNDAVVWASAGAPNLVTVSEGSFSSPIAGTFFVSYGEDFTPPASPVSPVTELQEVTVILGDIDAHQGGVFTLFGFTEQQLDDADILYTDHRGTRVRFITRDFFDMTTPGHAAIIFTLNEPVNERREVTFSDDQTLKAVYEGDTLKLILLPDGHDDWQERVRAFWNDAAQ